MWCKAIKINSYSSFVEPTYNSARFFYVNSIANTFSNTSAFAREEIQDRIWGSETHYHIRIAYSCKLQINYINK